MNQTKIALTQLLSATADVGLALQQIQSTRAVCQNLVWHEALMRPTGADVLDVVRSAQASGQGGALDRAVWVAACRVLSTAPQIDRLSINVTPAALREPGFASDMLDRALLMGVDPSVIVVEVSELFELGADDQAVMDNLTTFAAMSVKLAIDDFGGGQSHLHLLSSGLVSILKIDPNLIEWTVSHSTPRSRDVLAATIAFAHGLGIEVVAEGISSPAAERIAIAAGADWVQGWAIHTPEPAHDLLYRVHEGPVLAQAA